MSDTQVSVSNTRSTLGSRYATPNHGPFFRFAIACFSLSALGILAIILIVLIEYFAGMTFFGQFVLDEDPIIFRFIAPNLVFLLLAVVSFFSVFIGYRLVAATGATTINVIPERDYDLLAPLVSDGKSESIDQYVRLSSLTRFTGTFTQLGLSGLPLATIGLTLFFSIMAIVEPGSFLDLAKLTLGAFIGSFVQRQVETRTANNSDFSESIGSMS
jgi:amino acid transporter